LSGAGSGAGTARRFEEGSKGGEPRPLRRGRGFLGRLGVLGGT